jgi:ABC-2 type transport system permease protein
VADVFAVASKEFSDIVRSKRFIILIVIFGLVMTIAMAAIYIQVIQAMSSLPEVPMPQAFLGMMALILSGTLSSFAPVMGVALGCDTISGEREKGTLKIVLAQPVYRDTVINGKFLAAASAVSLATLITSLASVGISIIIIGVTPTAGEAIRMALFLLFSVLFTMTYYGISTFLSTILKKTSQSVILSVVVWAVFTFVISIIASLIAFTIAPPYIPGQPSDEESIRRYTAIVEAISSITPNYHFSKIGQYLLSPYSPTATQEEVSIVSSLMYAGPNILVLVIVTALVFVFSYITFTRQEVR